MAFMHVSVLLHALTTWGWQFPPEQWPSTTSPLLQVRGEHISLFVTGEHVPFGLPVADPAHE
jgi:hypothetical protein